MSKTSSRRKTSVANAAPTAARRARRRKKTGGRGIRPAGIGRPLAVNPPAAEPTSTLLYPSGSFIFVKLMGNRLAVARLKEHMYTVKGPVRGQEGIREWVEPAVVPVTYYQEDDNLEVKVGHTTMRPETTDGADRVDRGSIHGAVECERGDGMIVISSKEMTRMTTVIETPIVAEPSPSQSWSAAAEPGSERSLAPGASQLFDEIRAGNWANAGIMAHLQESKRTAWMAADLFNRTVEFNECWEQCRLAYEARSVSRDAAGRPKRTRGLSNRALEAVANAAAAPGNRQPKRRK